MVTRRTRNFKEKKPMTTFGQLILPLTVIMAVALLFFSVKLFFFNSSETGDMLFTKEDNTKNETLQAAPVEKTESVPVKGTTDTKKVDIKPAQPVDPKKEEIQKSDMADTQTKVSSKPSDSVKETVGKVAKSQQPQVKEASRWDVQIGAFSSKDNASQLVEKVRSKGYAAYLVEEKKEGAPFYKVRVKNPKTGRDEALALSKKLEKEGYPYFLVEIKKSQ